MSYYKPYPVYRDFCVEWIGKVPEHWDVMRLRHVITNQVVVNVTVTGSVFLFCLLNQAVWTEKSGISNLRMHIADETGISRRLSFCVS